MRPSGGSAPREPPRYPSLGSGFIGQSAADGAATAAGSLQGPNHMAGTRSTSSALLDDAGVVRTAAESVSTGISLADGALRIASVTTRSETVLGPGDAKPVTATSLMVEGASVAGHAVTIDADGVHAEGRAVPAPVGQGAGSDNQFLGQLGLSARIVPTGVPGGADALVITSRQTFPAPGNPKGTLVMTFGGATSEITVGSADGPALDPVPADRAAPPPAPGGPTPASGTPIAGGSAGAAEGATPPSTVAAGRPGAGGCGTAGSGESGLAAVGGRGLSGVGEPGPVGVADCGVGSVGSGLGGSGGRGAGAAASGATPVVGNGGSGESAAGTGIVPVRGASRFVVQPDLGTTGALYSLLGLGGIGLVGATRLLRWRGARR